MIDPSIFRAYDIRGVVDESLTENNLFLIGKALGSAVIDAGEKSIVTARDGRLSGPKLSASLCQGLLSTGCHVIDIGLVPTPILYFATHTLNTKSGVMLTGSHNPAHYNGLKMMVAGETLSENKIKQLYYRIQEKNFNEGEGQFNEKNIIEDYVNCILKDILLKKKLKVVVDCGNGIAGKILPDLLKKLGCEVHPLFCEVDGNFPHHHPDPSQPENLKDLIQQVKEKKADVGLAFDGDGDRLGVVTDQGEIIWPDRQLMLFAKDVLEKNPGAKIIYDVKCSHHLAKVIREAKGEPIMWKTGHSLIKSKLAETKAILAGEMSGHLFFKDRWYGFDDAIYAACRLLEVLSKSKQSCHGLFKTIPDSVNTPELKIYMHDDEKFHFMNELIKLADFSTAEVLTLDGLRVNFLDGWGLVRPSNTTPCLIMRFEAENKLILEKIQSIFRHFLLSVKPDLVLPF